MATLLNYLHVGQRNPKRRAASTQRYSTPTANPEALSGTPAQALKQGEAREVLCLDGGGSGWGMVVLGGTWAGCG